MHCLCFGSIVLQTEVWNAKKLNGNLLQIQNIDEMEDHLGFLMLKQKTEM